VGWLEPLSLYLLMTLITVGVGVAQGALAWVAGYGVLITALAFMYLPTWALERRGERPEDFGIGSGRALRATRGALKVGLIVFPLYIGAYHLWARAEGRSLSASVHALSRWGEDLRGRPLSALEVGEVRLYGDRDQLTLAWRLSPHERSLKARLAGWGEARVVARSAGVKLTRPSPQSSPSVPLLEVDGGRRGRLTLSAPASSVRYAFEVDGAPLSGERLKLGALLSSPEGEARGEAHRGWWWLLLTLATQLLLVALPEEIFYRGYLQGRLDQLVGRDRELFGAQVNLTSVTLTSVLFALAHLATIHHPARLAVFFPSLLFGWMRRAYGDTLTPALFHALSNVLAQLLWGLYPPPL
jgi:membrane protease YdiL (CAAX protease family)